MSKHFLLGMLPDTIRLEAHFTHLAPGAPPEPIGTHKHTEIWSEKRFVTRARLLAGP
jgi:hypothetical protein